MAIAQNNTITYADIRNLFDRVNSERNRFGMSVVNSSSIISVGKQTSATDVHNQLKSLVQGMTSNTFLATVASTSSISNVAAGDKMVPAGLVTLASILTNIENTNPRVTTGTANKFNAFNFNSAFGASGTFNAAHEPTGTFNAAHSPTGTFNAAHEPSGTFNSAHEPTGTFNAAHSPSGTFHASFLDTGTFRSAYGTGNGTYITNRTFCSSGFSFDGSFDSHKRNTFSGFYGTHFYSYGFRFSTFNVTHFYAYGRYNTTYGFRFTTFNGVHFGTFKSAHCWRIGAQVVFRTHFAGYFSGFRSSHFSGFRSGHFSAFNTTHFGSFVRGRFDSFKSGHFSAFVMGRFDSHNTTHNSSVCLTVCSTFYFGFSSFNRTHFSAHGSGNEGFNSRFASGFASFNARHLASFSSFNARHGASFTSFNARHRASFSSFNARHGSSFTSFNARHGSSFTSFNARFTSGCASAFFSSHIYSFSGFNNNFCPAGFCPSGFHAASYFNTL